MFVQTPVANMYREPSFSSEMITQSLMGEYLKVLKKQDNWVYVEQWDGYVSWVNKFYLSDYENEKLSTKVTILNDFEKLYNPSNMKQSFGNVSFGTELTIVEEKDEKIIVKLPNQKKACISKQHKVPFTEKRCQIIHFAKLLLGVPYIWGGKSTFGFDCSGFVQSVFKVVGIDFKRDSSQQAIDKSLNDLSLNEIEKGDLLFFAENQNITHVAISLGKLDFIHCSGMVRINSFDDKSKLYNANLKNWHVKTLSIKNLI
jgi:hypothetical protein